MGDLNAHATLQAATAAADIVINTAPDISHDADIRAILTGLTAGRSPCSSSSSPSPPPRYYIHTSGASLLWDEPTGLPDARAEPWDDIADQATIAALQPAAHTQAATDQIVRDFAGRDGDGLRVAIVAPGCVGGLSPSRAQPTPITLRSTLRAARAFGGGFQIARGDNAMAWIHVEDLAGMYLVLVGDALAALRGGARGRGSAPGGVQVWGPEAYYFGAETTFVFAQYMRDLVAVLRELGVVASSEIKSVSVTELARISLAGPGGEYDPLASPPPADSWEMHMAIMYGVNMRLRASRIKTLGWKAQKLPSAGSLKEVVARHLQLEKEEEDQKQGAKE